MKRLLAAINHGKIRRLSGDERGVVTVEFAFFATTLFSLIVVIADFGAAWAERMKIQNAARAGAQLALVTHASFDPAADDTDAAVSPNDIKTAIVNATGLDSSEVTVSMKCRCPDGTAVSDCYDDAAVTTACGDQLEDENKYRTYIVVDTNKTYSLLLYYPGLGQTLNLTGSNEVRLN